MNRLKGPIRLLTVGLALLLTLLRVADGTAQTQARLSFTPDPVDVPLDDTVTAGVMVADVDDLYGFDITFTFDPEAVQIVDADPQTAGAQLALGAFLDAGFVLINEVDNVAGTARYAMTQLNPSTPRDGAGILIVITLRGQPAGLQQPTSLTFGDVILANDRAQVLPSTTEEGRVRVVESQAQGVTSTPIPTQSAGTPQPTRTPLPTSAAPTATPPATSTAQTEPTTAPTMTGVPRQPTSTLTRRLPGSEPDGGNATATPALPTATPTTTTPTPAPTGTGTTAEASDSPPPDNGDAVARAGTPAPTPPNSQPAVGAPVDGIGTNVTAPSRSEAPAGDRPVRSWLPILGLIGGVLALSAGAFVLGRRLA